MRLRILELLKQKNKSVYWLRQITGISHTTIYKMANNLTAMITLKNIEILCNALECTPSDLFVFEDSITENNTDTRNDDSGLL